MRLPVPEKNDLFLCSPTPDAQLVAPKLVRGGGERHLFPGKTYRTEVRLRCWGLRTAPLLVAAHPVERRERWASSGAAAFSFSVGGRCCHAAGGAAPPKKAPDLTFLLAASSLAVPSP